MEAIGWKLSLPHWRYRAECTNLAEFERESRIYSAVKWARICWAQLRIHLDSSFPHGPCPGTVLRLFEPCEGPLCPYYQEIVNILPHWGPHAPAQLWCVVSSCSCICDSAAACTEVLKCKWRAGKAAFQWHCSLKGCCRSTEITLWGKKWVQQSVFLSC